MAGPERRPSLRPTRLGLLPLVGAGALGGLAVVTGDSWLLLLAAGFLGVTIGARLLHPRLREVQVGVSSPARVTLGERVQTSVHVRNNGRRTLPLTRVHHHVDGLADITVLVDALPPGACAGVTLTRLATARGVATEGTVTVTSTAPLGLLSARTSGTVSADLVVHPVVLRVPAQPLSDAADSGGTPVRSRSGLDVHGIRDWQRGDDARQVHWRSTARRGRLVVLEREEPRGGRLDLCVVGPDAAPDWEPLVSAVASLAVATARTGRQVRLLATDPHATGWRELVSTQETELLDWCAALRTVLPPGAAALARLAQHVGPAELTVALTRPAATWWDHAAPAAAGSGLRFVPLVAS
jgi:uncharacterized protein (DUF58 family)